MSIEERKRKLKEINTTGVDVTIIGSGLGGLCAASALAKVGYKVCVLEHTRVFMFMYTYL